MQRSARFFNGFEVIHFLLDPRRLVDYPREERPVPHAGDMLLRGGRSEVPVLLGNLGTRVEGLTAIEAAQRLAQQGRNVLPGQQSPGALCCCDALCGIPGNWVFPLSPCWVTP